ncbi:MAG: von Willebrand factor type A domain-containing protein [Nannocystaceae bacterium]
MSPVASPPSSSSSTIAVPRRDRSRSRLLLSACALLAVGIGINLHRHLAIEPSAIEVDDITAAQTTKPRHVARLEQDAERAAQSVDGDDEAGGQGQRHKGSEGRMGRPRSNGLYAMKAPSGLVPQMARNFDPDLMARQAGILGHMSESSGHFLASPYGAAMAVGSDDLWGGMVSRATTTDAVPPPPSHVESYQDWVARSFIVAEDDATSTFSIDVDTGSYSLLRTMVSDHDRMPDSSSLRIEELVNYFDYEYPEPAGQVPISIVSEVGPCPWDDEHRLVHVGLQGRHVALADVPPRNLVFLVDVSGSMEPSLPLVVSSLAYLTEQLDERDTISIVVYAGASGTVLPPTPGSDKATILRALDRLEAGGGTNGAQGIELAYRLAEQHFVEGGINRVMLATDGDFNVGITDPDALVELIEAKRRTGVFLSALGFGMGNYQDTTMEQLADHGNGNYAYIDGLAEARKVLVEQANATLVTIAKDVKIQVELDPAAVRSYRLVGYDNRVLADRDFADDTKDAGEIGSGHTVTALYEVELQPGADPADALMELRLRYKEPDGDRSRLVSVEVLDEGQTLEHSTDDFRFAAAVAGFGEVLRNTPRKRESGQLRALYELAQGARGADRHCRRAELVQLMARVGTLMGEPLPDADLSCTEVPEPRTAVARSAAVPAETPAEDPPTDWARFIIEVLYLLPPLLALPLFVMALRRPRRRRRRG